MKPWQISPSKEPEEMVDAIEEGKIVKVSMDYAKREGLPILRKNLIPTYEMPAKKKQVNEERITIDDLRKPLNKNQSQVASELVENFHWVISKKRRGIGLSRRQLAEDIKESESNLKLIENGIIPRDDFVIINKIQERLKINIRKDKKDFNQPARSLINQEKENPPKKAQSSFQASSMSGNDIELFTEDPKSSED